MSLYQNLNHRRQEEAERWTTLRHSGFGGISRLSPSRANKRRVEMVNSSAGNTRRGRGLLRALLGAALVFWSLAHFRPFHRLSALGKAVKPAISQWAAPQSVASQRQREGADQETEAVPVADGENPESEGGKPAPEKARLTDRFTGQAAALAALGKGRWAEVDCSGYARPAKGPDDPAHFGLPLLKGTIVKTVSEGRGWVQKADFRAAALEGFFPLPAELSSEVAWVDLGNEDNPRLGTHDGVVAWLGPGPYAPKLLRLSAVLADLSARGKVPKVIDMRFEGSAVVRLASK